MGSSAPSLFRRLIAAISLVLLLGAAVLLWTAQNYARKAADNVYDGLLVGVASQIGETVRISSGSIVTDIPASAFETLSISRRERVYYRVIAPNGQTLTGYDDLALPASIKDVPELSLTSFAIPEADIWEAEFKGSKVRVAATRHFVADKSTSGFVTILVAQTMITRMSLAREMTLRVSLLIAVLSVIALAGAMLATWYALRPLQQIEQALSARDPNDLTPLNVYAPVEIEALTRSINRFMARLGERMNTIQHVIADAAHQIRTPVMALAAQVELLKQENVSAKQLRHLERVSFRTSQIGRLVSQLLSQAMISHRANSVAASQINVEDLVRQAVADAIPTEMDRDISVKFSADGDDLVVSGDPVALREAVRNVIENAVHHGGKTAIDVSVHRVGQYVEIRVADDGPGIPESFWPEASKRFFRVSDDKSGSGLGLAIAEEVARNHGASLDFGVEHNGFFSVSIKLQAARLGPG
jgi:two-component system, OmpR family, sensor histidine kinase TctE